MLILLQGSQNVETFGLHSQNTKHSSLLNEVTVQVLPVVSEYIYHITTLYELFLSSLEWVEGISLNILLGFSLLKL